MVLSRGGLGCLAGGPVLGGVLARGADGDGLADLAKDCAANDVADELTACGGVRLNQLGLLIREATGDNPV
jgi:hypothetical protein